MSQMKKKCLTEFFKKYYWLRKTEKFTVYGQNNTGSDETVAHELFLLFFFNLHHIL